MNEKVIDNRGLECPQPVINTKKALEALAKGTLISLVDNETAKENVSRLVQSMGCTCEIEEKDGLFYLHITKDAQSQASGQTAAPAPSLYANRVLLISSAGFGSGEPELSNILMKSLLYTVSQAIDLLPKHIILINEGVTLALPEALPFAHLQQLSELGVDIICCGTCLDYYGLKNQYKVGRVTNMYEIYELISANTVVRI